MSDEFTAMGDAAPTTQAAPSTRIRGGWLLAARLGWLLLLIATLAPFLASLPDYIASVEHPSPANAVLTPGAARALQTIGVSRSAYSWVSFAILGVVVLISLALALLLAWRRNDDWMALAVSLFIIVYTISGIGNPQPNHSVNPNTALAVTVAILENVPGFILILGVLLIFPNGRFAPRWAWMIFVVLSIWTFGLTVFPTLLGGALILGYPIGFITIIACMVYRYQRVSTPIERLQTKWVVGALVLTLVANQIFWLPSGFTPLGQTLYAPFVYLIYQLAFALAPISFFIAIQRYRLYDIDTIINRALVYGALTLTLVGVYAACVIGAQKALSAITLSAESQNNPVVIVITTLLVAALFRPVRAGLQRFVDRRFYRGKYDAARTVADFGVTLREEVDLATLQERLLATVERTVQPAHASITLFAPARPAAHERPPG